MKLYHPDETVTSCSFEGQAIERGEDGSFEAPDHAAELLAHGFTTQKPEAPAPGQDHLSQGTKHDDDETGEDVLVKLAATTKANIAAYALQAYGLELDTTKKKDDLLMAVAEAAAKAADEAQANAMLEQAAKLATEGKHEEAAELVAQANAMLGLAPTE